MWMRASTLGHPHRWPTPENANRTHPAAEATAFREGGPRPGCVKTHPNRKLQRSALREQHCGHTRHAASTLPSAMFLSRHQFWIGDGSFSHRPGWRWADAANGHPYWPNAFNKPRSRPPARPKRSLGMRIPLATRRWITLRPTPEWNRSWTPNAILIPPKAENHVATHAKTLAWHAKPGRRRRPWAVAEHRSTKQNMGMGMPPFPQLTWGEAVYPTS